MIATTRIDPEAIFDDASLCASLDLGAQTIARARRAGQLRYTRKGNRILYLGQWVLDWLMSDNELPQ